MRFSLSSRAEADRWSIRRGTCSSCFQQDLRCATRRCSGCRGRDASAGIRIAVTRPLPLIFRVSPAPLLVAFLLFIVSRIAPPGICS